MKIGSLFSGGGLGDFGFMAAGMEISWQVEIDPYCQKILSLRYPESKKYTDIKTLKGADLEKVDIITGGFPCQPFSYAGKRTGKEDNRYLWPEMLRIIKECNPRWIVGENVPGIINMALDTVCADLEAEGYEVWPIVFPSHALGAWHKRDRLWIICHSKQSRSQGYSWDVSNRDESRRNEKEENRSIGETGLCGDISNAISSRSQESRPKQQTNRSGQLHEIDWRKTWKVEPGLGRVVDGCSDRVDRLKMLGNGQVPACTYVIGKMIMEIENKKENK